MTNSIAGFSDIKELASWLSWAIPSPPITSRLRARSEETARPEVSDGERGRSRRLHQYGTRRGNHEVMMRGTFANIRIKNEMVPGVEGG